MPISIRRSVAGECSRLCLHFGFGRGASSFGTSIIATPIAVTPPINCRQSSGKSWRSCWQRRSLSVTQGESSGNGEGTVDHFAAGSICFIMPNIGILLARVATMPLPRCCSYSAPYRRSSAVFQTASQQQHHRIRPQQHAGDRTITSMARITSPGLSPGAMKIGPDRGSVPNRAGISLPQRQDQGDQCNVEFGEDLEAVDHFFGMNFSPSATSTATISTGIMLSGSAQR